MSSKSTPRSAASKSSAADPLRESAHEIWLAGLGAFTKAQQEGGKMYDTLVQEGLAMQRKAQTAAEEKLSEAGEKVSSLARDIETRATGQWDKLESLFEDRVARAMQRLGIPSARAVHALTTRLTDLEKQLQARTARAAPAKKATTAKKATPAKKAALKKTAAKKASPAKKAAPRKTARK
jgi:poly(hydroxyalkanoate) granule-associated protein